MAILGNSAELCRLFFGRLQSGGFEAVRDFGVTAEGGAVGAMTGHGRDDPLGAGCEKGSLGKGAACKVRRCNGGNAHGLGVTCSWVLHNNVAVDAGENDAALDGVVITLGADKG